MGYIITIMFVCVPVSLPILWTLILQGIHSKIQAQFSEWSLVTLEVEPTNPNLP